MNNAKITLDGDWISIEGKRLFKVKGYIIKSLDTSILDDMCDEDFNSTITLSETYKPYVYLQLKYHSEIQQFIDNN